MQRLYGRISAYIGRAACIFRGRRALPSPFGPPISPSSVTRGGGDRHPNGSATPQPAVHPPYEPRVARRRLPGRRELGDLSRALRAQLVTSF